MYSPMKLSTAACIPSRIVKDHWFESINERLCLNPSGCVVQKLEPPKENIFGCPPCFLDKFVLFYSDLN